MWSTRLNRGVGAGRQTTVACALTNGGGAYFNTSFNDDRSPTGTFVANKSFYSGYQTSILGNVSINWIKEVVTKNGTAGPGYEHPPFFAYVGVHAPHLPSQPAPWYAENTFMDQSLAKHYLSLIHI